MPLPSFSWASGADVWQAMLEKDAIYAKLKNPDMLTHHPALVPSYRTILLDWLSEVSQECNFHRETYHLAVDLADRFLSIKSGVNKLKLQLIGATCLFVAAKFEEIYPPAISEFADLTDGACTVDDIVNQEVIILDSLNWDITPVTPNTWLNTYMQILITLDQQHQQTNNDDDDDDDGENEGQAHDGSQLACPNLSETENDAFMIPMNNGILRPSHKRIACIIDLALLHIDSLKYASSTLAASAMSFFVDTRTLYQCTGFTCSQLAHCIKWLTPFVETVREIQEQVFILSSRGANSVQMHSHTATAATLEMVSARRKRKLCALQYTATSNTENIMPAAGERHQTPPTSLLTPPKSASKKQRTA